MKDYIICTPVMLPINEDSGLCLINGKIVSVFLEDIDYRSRVDFKPHHLYLVSEGEIKERDWYIQSGKYLYRGGYGDAISADCRKLEATTDKALSLPLIPTSFIEKWVNEQGKINKVRVELDAKNPIANEWELEVATDQGEVIILPIEDKMLPEKRVIALMAATAHHVRTNGYGPWSISNGLARQLYSRWENVEDEDYTTIPPEDKIYSREELEAICKAWTNYNWVMGFSWNEHKPKVSFLKWLDKEYQQNKIKTP